MKVCVIITILLSDGGEVLEKETTTIRVPDTIMQEIRQEAADMGLSTNSYMLAAISMGRRILNANPALRLDAPQQT